MKILVCITHVPDTTSRISFTDDGKTFDKTNVQFIIGPYDDYALARAVELKEAQGGTVTVLNVGESDAEPTIRKALAIGADEAIRVNAFPSDSWFVAQQIAHIAREGQYDLILMGRESIDFNSGVVHGMVGALLSMPSVSPVMALNVEGEVVKMEREIEGGQEHLEARLPLVAGCQEPIAEWKIPNMRGIMTARSKPLVVVDPVESDAQIRSEKFELPPPKGKIVMVDPDKPEDLLQQLKEDGVL